MSSTIVVSIIVVLLLLTAVLYWIFRPKPLLPLPADAQTEWAKLLQQYVKYYARLDDAEKERFRQRVNAFLQRVKITGIETEVEELDRILVAASAVIPTFGFPAWNQYPKLEQVLLYKTAFRRGDFATEGTDRRVAGMVGGGYLNGKLLLTRPSLRNGFLQEGPDNTGIHEFVHLLDKADGETDGIPEYFLENSYVVPWLEMIREETEAIRRGESDIDTYAATNKAEFFAVTAEYFFDRPHDLAEDHPELYELLERVFRQDLLD